MFNNDVKNVGLKGTKLTLLLVSHFLSVRAFRGELEKNSIPQKMKSFPCHRRPIMYFLKVFVSFDHDAVAILLFDDEALSKIDRVKLVP